ncbi:MetQ/NlpA family ABC transporter substrate-binding protein [Weissella confusa]|uniref:Lipoprotein n=1 Tax=Weissella confusa TaxID=1583 RepID=A0A4Z0RJZ3_WEICO|nr:MetQ/NlpA family ABC transporter substrate-binding protein [Weissella confusa]MBJ7615922.1 MetQ/NlpA family ABC transporter substrate-binding protein [Weissella confusa]MBJ7626166.1 MetQ/NlpA family ABC transporter substrate-binding protein [Weissella confusa]MBJ7631900.1 MetQ/NlpA family ABC transporter substrate-binding protein [Weissella confusa]MBJ7639158.1 MetQ/NlpA family ABC transporter substrate-binding protein [Weissella confusa]MBJ7644708.1 MetQ/NlpA family ABC transporter substra
MGISKKQVVLGTVVAVAGLAVFANQPHDVSAASKDKTVTVGLVGDSDRQLWEYVKKDAAKKYGIDIKLKLFTDYIKPNQALVDKSIDLNAFQTINYFDVQNKNFKGKLVSVGKTYVTPIRIYSDNHKTLADLPKGGTIVVPNDPSNEKRALDVLEAAGLIKYNHDVKLPSAQDITENKKDFKIKEVASDQAASALKSADAAVVNTNYALDAKLDIDKALYVEPVNKANKGYINIIAARKGTQNKKIYKQVVKAYQTESTKKHMKQLYGSAEIAAWDIKLK